MRYKLNSQIGGPTWGNYSLPELLLPTPLHSSPLLPTQLLSSPPLSSPLLSTPSPSSTLLPTPLHSFPPLSIPPHSYPFLSTSLHSSPPLPTHLHSSPLLHSLPLWVVMAERIEGEMDLRSWRDAGRDPSWADWMPS